MKVLASTTQPPSLGLPAGDLLLHDVRVVLGDSGARAARAAARPGRASRPGVLCKSGAWPTTAAGGRDFLGDCVEHALPLEVQRSTFNVQRSTFKAKPAKQERKLRIGADNTDNI